MYARRRGGFSPRRERGSPTVAATRTVEERELDKKRRELKSLLVEKEMLTGAITRVFEAEAEGRITRDEREHLSSRYREQLSGVEEKLGNAELYIEVGELERLREELVNLFQKKIEQIERRLEETRNRVQGIKPSAGPTPLLKEEKAVEKKEEKKKVKPETAEVDERVKALRDEVLEALARLEQMDVEG